MNVTISASALSGSITPPASKSFAHRQLIAAALADARSTIIIDQPSDDISATVSCIEHGTGGLLCHYI